MWAESCLANSASCLERATVEKQIRQIDSKDPSLFRRWEKRGESSDMVRVGEAEKGCPVENAQNRGRVDGLGVPFSGGILKVTQMGDGFGNANRVIVR
jgi:hypothetical protein